MYDTPIRFDEALPINTRHDEIVAAIRHHPVVIVCGETGSGKTTQLPKLCLALGRGKAGLIGHTQPRRIAATTVARRIAEELGTPLESPDSLVGYQVRFQQRGARNARIRLMTDGILLAQTQTDPALQRYDTLIIDEAHERSLNIDFLLGYLHLLVPKRPDLRIIITSATLDASRFAAHFAQAGQPAPVIEVSGRLHPVEVRYRPVLQEASSAADSLPTSTAAPNVALPPAESDPDRDLPQAVHDAVEECLTHGPGDILVFLPGEREIHECAQTLNGGFSTARSRAPLEVVPLFARLSAAEQERVFQPGAARRVVLATNVAETSLTVPRIAFVVDSGLARVNRYSFKRKFERLAIEPISQAAAKQRAGRCGRLGPGLCLRLYSEADFQARPAYTDPEILRSSLASVILRMKALRLDDIAGFPFVDPPSGRAIAEGLQTLVELNALDAQQQLTPIGQQLSQAPVDPRLGRMLVEARHRGCLRELLIIAAALALQDPRERPAAAQASADAAHKRLADPSSEILGWLKLWAWVQQQRQVHPSRRKFTAALKQQFLSPNRVREWEDLQSQLEVWVKTQSWTLNASAGSADMIHQSVLAGLLSQIAVKAEGEPHYVGARGISCWLHPGVLLSRKPSAWLMAAEWLETRRLFLRGVAPIDPRWLEHLAAHLISRSWHQPHWEKKSGQTVALERAMLFGLTLYQGRRVSYAKLDATEARHLFIREGLIPAALSRLPAFVQHNLALVERLEAEAHRARRYAAPVDEETLFAFYDARIPNDVLDLAGLEHWLKQALKDEVTALYLDEAVLLQRQSGNDPRYPTVWRAAGTTLALQYHFEPGSPRDGVTLRLPLLVLNQINARDGEWLVPGMLPEKILALIKSLPPKIRHRLQPLPSYAEQAAHRIADQAGKVELLKALNRDVQTQTGLRLADTDYRVETLKPHMRMRYELLDDSDRIVAQSRDLAALQSEWGLRASSQFRDAMTAAGWAAPATETPQPGTQALKTAIADIKVAAPLASPAAQQKFTAWTFDALPEHVALERDGQTVIGFPALVDHRSHCEIENFDTPAQAAQAHRRGLLRLYRFALKDRLKQIDRHLPALPEIGLLYLSLGSQESIRDDIVDHAIDTVAIEGKPPRSAAEFEARSRDARTRVLLVAQETARLVLQILQEWSRLNKQLQSARVDANMIADIRQQVQQLVFSGFLLKLPRDRLAALPRYLQAAQQRLEKARSDPARDQQLSRELNPLLQNYQRVVQQHRRVIDPRLEEFRWQLEELRVSLYAQTLKTAYPVSVKRLWKVWETLQSSV